MDFHQVNQAGTRGCRIALKSGAAICFGFG
jgi:hypothetical protein